MLDLFIKGFMIPTLFILTNTFCAKLFQLLTFIYFSFTIHLLFAFYYSFYVINDLILRIIRKLLYLLAILLFYQILHNHIILPYDI